MAKGRRIAVRDPDVPRLPTASSGRPRRVARRRAESSDDRLRPLRRVDRAAIVLRCRADRVEHLVDGGVAVTSAGRDGDKVELGLVVVGSSAVCGLGGESGCLEVALLERVRDDDGGDLDTQVNGPGA